MSQPHVPWDPRDADPLHVVERELEVWEAGYAAAIDGQRWRVAGLLLAGLSGAIVGALLTVAIVSAAAPRSGSLPPIPVADAGQTGAPRGQAGTGFAPGVATGPAAAEFPSGAPITGIASYVGAFLGDRYLALPEGRGVRVRICAGDRCIVRTSTDAGPDLAMQRRGRVADVSYRDFAWLCRCHPPDVGLVPVTVTRLGPGVTPPPTETEP